jgi:peptide/nickel transport system ATP-binding protein
MYLGMVVERGPVEVIFAEPQHPYTRALLRSLPKVGRQRTTRLTAIQGNVPHPLQRPSGCPFHPRCDFAVAGLCDVLPPPAIRLADGRDVRCFAYTGEHTITLDEHSVRDGSDASTIPAPSTSTPPINTPFTNTNHPLLDVRNLQMHFPLTTGFLNRVTGHVKAVDGVSFAIYAGETLGLVGESGCGKTTLGHALMRLYKPTAGTIVYDNANGNPPDLAQLRDRELKRYRSEIRMIFQDPYASLNPRLPVLEIVGEVLRVNGIAKGRTLEARVGALLEKVGLSPQYLHRYPHAFSGGQRQRIGIARALAPNPRLVIADEPVSALDVSVQAQILNLLKDLQAELALTYLFISHDLNVVAYISDRVAVMYVGKIVELAPTAQIFANPQHPYTEALLSAILPPDPRRRAHSSRIRLAGNVADPANPPTGCAFHPRCRYAQARCQAETPTLRQTEAGQLVACHFAEELQLVGVVGE